MNNLQELNTIADELIKGSLNWTDEEVPEELVCRTPLFTHTTQEGYEFDFDDTFGCVVVQWAPVVEEGTFTPNAWTGRKVEAWVRDLALVTGGDASGLTVGTLSELLIHKLVALGMRNDNRGYFV